MLNCSYNLGMRHLKGYIPEYPVGTADEIADKMVEFVPIARTLLGFRGLTDFEKIPPCGKCISHCQLDRQGEQMGKFRESADADNG